jgi:hypothetical protein
MGRQKQKGLDWIPSGFDGSVKLDKKWNIFTRHGIPYLVCVKNSGDEN